MPDRSKTLESLIALAEEKKKVKKLSSVITRELLDLGLGFYQFPAKKSGEKLIEKIESFEKLAELKAEHGVALVKLQSHQVEALNVYLKAKEKFSVGISAMDSYKSTDNIKGISIEMEAAVSAAAKFEASWDAGVTAEAKLEVGYQLTYGGKYVSWTSGAKAAVQAKLKLKPTSVEAEASATAEVMHNISTAPINIPGTKYELKFYTEWKAYAKAEARFKAELSLSASNFVNATAQGKVFAGIGVSGEIGVQILGKGGTHPSRSKITRPLAIANLNATLEAGALASFGAEFGGSGEEVIDGDTYDKKVFKVAIGLGIGAEVTFNVIVLQEITEDIKAKIITRIQELVTELIGQEMFNYLVAKYEGFKAKAISVMTCLGNDIYVKFSSDTYKALYHAMDTNIIKLQEQLAALEVSGPTDKRISEAKARIVKVEENLLKYKTKIESVRSLCAGLMYEVSETLSNSDLTQGRSFGRAPEILGQLSDANEEIKNMVTAIEAVTAVNLEIIDISNMLDPDYGDAEFLANTQKMNALLNDQTYMQGTLEYIIDVMKDKIVEMTEQ